MLNLREAYYRPFMEEARGQTSAGLEFHHDDSEGSAVSGVMSSQDSIDALEGSGGKPSEKI